MPPGHAWSLPFLLPTLVLPHVALHAVTCLFLLETMSNKLSFQWQSSELLAPPHVSNNKTYILKLSLRQQDKLHLATD